MRNHTIRRAGALLLALSVALVACGDDDTASTPATTTTTTTTTAPSGGDEPSAPEEEPADDPADEPDASGTTIDVQVRGGTVDGGGRTAVPLGDTVTIRVTSDVADHVHLHGYDVLADVAAGTTAELTFDATIPGVFEVELEDAGLLLLELEIS
jgi:ABC-type glycerol-3-phosphate transport system substrate-binding protein